MTEHKFVVPWAHAGEQDQKSNANYKAIGKYDFNACVADTPANGVIVPDCRTEFKPLYSSDKKRTENSVLLA